MNAILAAALSRVVCATVPIPVDAAASASVLPSAAVGGFGAGVLGHLQAYGELNSCELVVFRF